MTDVRRTFEIFVTPGEVVEVRVPHATKYPYRRAGYFDNADAFEEAVTGIDGDAEAIYFTLNPVAPALLARANNRLVGTRDAANDGDVLRRRWLPFDFDPRRPPGISASDDEKAAAVARAGVVREWLNAQGWPDPVVTDSGNGAHLLYAVDLEPGSDLVGRVLNTVHTLFSDDAVDVDLKCKNPSRVMKVYGTLAQKGENMPDRPWRRSALVSVPDTVEVISVEQLEAVAAQMPERKRKAGEAPEFDVEAWLKKVGLKIHKGGDWPGMPGAQRWEIPTCPFNDDHDRGEAFIVQFPSNVVIAGCQHQSCTWGWNDLRDKLEPGWREDSVAALFGGVHGHPPADMFFTRHGSFIPGLLGDYIDSILHVVPDPAGQLWIYNGGIYVRDQRHAKIKALVREVLGLAWRPNHAPAVEQWFLAQENKIGVSLPPEDVINVANGLLDWRTGELRPHTPDVIMTTQLPAAWDPDAQCPKIEDFLRDVLPEDCIDLWYEILGRAIIGRPLFNKAVMLTGPGGTGKSQLIELMNQLLGDDNVVHIRFQSLTDNRFMVAELLGKLANTCGDISSRAVQDTDVFKACTTGDRLDAERKHQHPFKFRPFALLVFSANELPGTPDQTDAYFDRWVIVPMENRFRGTDREIPNYADVLASDSDEMSGLLVRAVEGLRRLMRRRRFASPETVETALFNFRAREDTVIAFGQEACTFGDPKTLHYPVADLFRRYRRHTEDSGRMPVGKQKFNERFERRFRDQVERGVIAGARVWKGVIFSGEAGVAANADSGDPSDGGGSTGTTGAVSGAVSDSKTAPASGGNCTTSEQVSDPGEASDPPSEDRWCSFAPETRILSSLYIARATPSQTVSRVAVEKSGGSGRKTAPATVLFDIETADAEDLWRYGKQFCRLLGYAVGDGEITLTTDMAALPAGTLVAHNGYCFDLLALARYHGLDILRTPAIDTKLLAFLNDPPPARMSEGQIERYYSLDELGQRLCGFGKTGDLKKLKKKFGGYDKIPVDDPEYRDYLTGDVAVLRALLPKLLPMSAYAEREHRIARIMGLMTVNGFRVDVPLLKQRVAAAAAKRAEMLARLEYLGLPETKADGKESRSPHQTDAGKKAIDAAFRELGVTLPRTNSLKKPQPQLGKDIMAAIEEEHAGTPVAALADTVRTLFGVRSIFDQISTCLVDDRVHPSVSARQATGRFSVTEPGLTVMGKRGGKYVEREVMIADEGHLLCSVDLAQIDARACGVHAQDHAYLDLFLPGIDGHTEIAKRVWGRGDEELRERAKVVSHSWNYGASPGRIVAETGVSYDVALEFDEAMRDEFPDLVRWRDEVREQARAGELLSNGFGRLMRPDPDRSYTQGPSFVGQGTARDLLMKGLLQVPEDLLGYLRGVIHDELIFSVPERDIDEVERAVVQALSFDWAPPGASRTVQIIAEPVGRGRNWGQIYAKKKEGGQ